MSQQPTQRNLFDFFQDEARSAMQAARAEVARTKHDALGPEHMLLGLLRTDPSSAKDALKDIGLDPAELIDAIENALEPGTTEEPPAQLPFSQQAQAVLQITMQAAGSLYHPSISTQHLMLALLQDQNGPLSKGLDALKADRNGLGEALMKRLRTIPPDPKMQAQAQAAAQAQAQAQAQQSMAGLTPSAQRVLDAARDQARELGHGQVGTVHLLLALMQDPDRMASNVFVKLRVRPEEVRGELMRVLRAAPKETSEAEAASESVGTT